MKKALFDRLARVPMLSLNEVMRRLHLRSFRSSKYWEKRYATGGTSGVGSYGELATYKAAVINAFISEYQIRSVIEFGCGDGNQLAYYNIPEYTGLEVSKTALKGCEERFQGDQSKRFLLYDNTFPCICGSLEKADLTLSIDVLYHLVKNDVFWTYLKNLFHHSRRYVVIYSSNFDSIHDSPHQVDRQFTPLIERNIKEFDLMRTIINPNKGNKTMSDWFFYRRRQ